MSHGHSHDGGGAAAAAEGGGPPPKKQKHLCHMGTQEVVHFRSFKSVPGKVDDFELKVQGITKQLYSLEAGITDVRVAHPQCGEINFIITFLTKCDLEKFNKTGGPGYIIFQSLAPLVDGGKPKYESSGTLMPAVHTLASLLDYLKDNVKGTCYGDHDVAAIKCELKNWFSRRQEFEKYVHWDSSNPKKYTRNVIFKNEHMDVLLMCWPPHSKSAIHDHDASSCFVLQVEGTIHEVQYAIPALDKTFLAREMKDPTGAVGRCGALRELSTTVMRTGNVQYANNELALHRVENRSDEPAFTLHVYAP
eukprot:gene15503-32884_t